MRSCCTVQPRRGERRGADGNPDLPPSVGVHPDSPEESKSSPIRQPPMECDEAMPDLLVCSRPHCHAPRSSEGSRDHEEDHQRGDCCSQLCSALCGELRDSMKSPVLSSVGAGLDLRSDKLVPSGPRQARAGPSFDDHQARPALQLSPPIDPRCIHGSPTASCWTLLALNNGIKPLVS